MSITSFLIRTVFKRGDEECAFFKGFLPQEGRA